jgi:hypothetical protein
MIRDEQAMRHRLEARAERQPQQSTPRPAFDSSVRQADGIGACKQFDPIGFVLLHKIEVTDRHPGVMLALAALVILAGAALEQVMP